MLLEVRFWIFSAVESWLPGSALRSVRFAINVPDFLLSWKEMKRFETEATEGKRRAYGEDRIAGAE